jgi:Lantibiotic dehydratase, N terminus
MTPPRTENHVVPLGDGRWSLWREAVLRAAGFPSSGLTMLSAAACARVADDHLVGKATRDEYDGAFSDAAAGNAATLHRLASDPLLREAITWQNLSALVSVDKIVEAGRQPRRTARHRSRERMLARYWQRYCGKAETVGFFGPLCWVMIDPAEPGVSARPGTGLIRDRAVYLEHWALAAFAERLASDPCVRQWLAPALAPHLTVRGREVIDTVRPPVRLTVAQAAVVAACDGCKSARQVADEVAAAPQAAVRTAADVFVLLEQLVERGILCWDFDLPVSLDAERVLRERIARIADGRARAAAEAALRLLSDHRDQVAAAAGDSARLAEALRALEDAFTGVAEHAARRSSGQMYAGRTLCVEETTRDLDVTFGKAVLEAVAAPLAVPLTIARWLCCTLSRTYLAELERLHADLADQQGEVPLGLLWFMAQGLFYGAARRPADDIAAELDRRWSRLLGLDQAPAACSALAFSSGDLAGPLAKLFPADGPAWAAARLHSLDIQFRARGAESFRRGDFGAVLGEVHAAWAAAGCGALVAVHPDPVRLRRALRCDLGGRAIYPLLPLTWARHTPRLAFALEDPRDPQLGFTVAPGADPGRLVPVSAVVVRHTADGLVAVVPGGRRWPLLEVFGRLLSELSVEAFKSAGSAPHVPRITVDGLVLARETWRMGVGDCPAVTARGERDEFLAVRRWRMALGLPEHVFVKLSTEVKPIFIDMTSPVYASMLAAALRAARRAAGDGASLMVTEMLPRPDEAWIPGTEGVRYIGELRLHVREEQVVLAGHEEKGAS